MVVLGCGTRTLHYCVVFILLLVVPSSAASIYGRQNVADSTTEPTTCEPTECGFCGDDNTYGKGIRIGVYLQWVTSSIAYNFVPEEAITMRGVNSCFQAAMFVGLLYITIINGQDLYAAEALIVLTMGMGGICSGSNSSKDEKGNPKIRSYAEYHVTTIGALIRVIISMGFVAYGVWFFFTGMDGMRHDSCTTYAFFFARVNLYNWFRTLMKVVFTITAISYALFALASMGILSWALVTKPREVFETLFLGGNAEKHSGVRSYGGACNTSFGISLALFILGTELTLRWNNVTNVSSIQSTGQIFPLVIGIGSLMRVAHKLCAAFYRVVTHQDI